MTVIAGLICKPPWRPAEHAAESMLGIVHAPACKILGSYTDRDVSLGARSEEGTGAIFVDADYIAVADCRLDNRQQLRSVTGQTANDPSDLELLVHGFKCLGSQLPNSLFGEFAFAIWDRKAQSLFCARDRFGVKALVYRSAEGSFRFATDMKSLATEVGMGSLPLNQDWILDYIEGSVTDTVSTPYRDVLRLPPAHSLYWKNGEISVSRFWSFGSTQQESMEIAPERVRDAFIDAVRKRLPEKGVAGLLSGGLDSTSICCVARDLQVQRDGALFDTISMVYDETPEESERTHIEAVVDSGGFDPRFVNVVDYRPIASLERMIEVQDAPFLAPGLPMLDNAMAEAQAAGFTTLLEGHGGDEVMSGVGETRLYELASAGAWASLGKELIQLSKRQKIRPVDMFLSIYGARGRGLLARVCRRVRSRLHTPAETIPLPVLLAEKWRGDKNLEDRIAPHRRWGGRFFETEREFQVWMLSGPLQSYAFETQSRAFRSRGLKVEFPFWDQSLIELCLQVPSSQKLCRGWSRNLIRTAMRGIIPEQIRTRTDKLDFSGHLVRGLLQDKETLNQFANDRSAPQFEYIDQKAFAEALARLGSDDRIDRTKAAQLVWRGASLSIWFKLLSRDYGRSRAPLEIKN